MFLFAVYPVFMWYLAMRWRRTWRGVASVGAGLFAMGLVTLLIGRFTWIEEADRTLLRAMMVPYGAFVGFIGLYIVSLPRPMSHKLLWVCGGCGYDMSGLPTDSASACPECGRTGAAVKPEVERIAEARQRRAAAALRRAARH